MASGKYEYQSEFAKTHQALGRAEGHTQGRTEGKVEGLAQAVLDVMSARGIAVSAAQRARIFACTDGAQLAVWLKNAATATRADQVL